MSIDFDRHRLDSLETHKHRVVEDQNICVNTYIGEK